MFKKLCILCLISLNSLFSSGITLCLADTTSELNQARDNVYALIEAGKLNEARAAKDRMLADFNNEPNLPEVWHLIAVQYERFNKFDEAKSNFQQIVQNHPDSPFANKARLGISRAEAMALVMSQKFDLAKAAVDKMAGDFAGNPDLPEAIYWTAERFKRFDRFADAKQLYHKIVQNYPESPWAEKARFCVARADVMISFIAQDYDQVNKAIDKLAVDFAGQPDLPEALYWLTERFERAGRFEGAKRNYQRIIQNYASSPWVEKARLGISRSEAMALIALEKFDAAQKATDKMAVDFAGNPDLPEALYWTTERFERVNRFEELKRNYQTLIQNYPDSPWAQKARLGISRAEVISYILSRDYDSARSALNKMSVDFAGSAGLPGAIYWITERYEFADKLDEAKGIYEQIIQNHPDSPYAGKAKLGIRRVGVMALMNSSDINAADGAIDKMITDFRDNPELPRAVFGIGAKCFLDAKAPGYRRRAAKIVERVIEELPKTEAMAGMYEEAYCCAGDCYFALNNYVKALSYYKKLASEFPEHRLSAKAQLRTAEIYQKLEGSGSIAKSEAQAQIRLAYEQLLLKYPDSKYADSARNWLEQHKPGTGGQE